MKTVDSFDTPPQGFTRQGANRGWIVPAQTPHKKKLDRLAAENADLKSMIQDLHTRLTALEPAVEEEQKSTKRKKRGE